MLNIIIDVFNEMLFNPEKKAWIPFDENITLRIILILSNSKISLDIQNKLLNENSSLIYNRDERIKKAIENISNNFANNL